MNIALIYTPDTDDAAEALAQAEQLAEGIGQEGENISVMGPIEDGVTWTAGGDTDSATILLDALRMFADAHSEGDDAGDPDGVWSKATRMIEAIETQVGE